MSDSSNLRNRPHYSRSRTARRRAVTEHSNNNQPPGYGIHAIAVHIGDSTVRLVSDTWSCFYRWGPRPLYFVAFVHLLINLLVFFYAQPADCQSGASQVINNYSGIAIELNGTGAIRMTREAVVHIHTTKSTLIHVHEAFHAIYCDALAFADGFLEMHPRDDVSASLQYFANSRRGRTTSVFSGICPTKYYPKEVVPLTSKAARLLSLALHDVLVLTKDLALRSGEAATGFAIVMEKSDFAVVEREAEAKDTFLWTRWFVIGDAIQDGCSLQLQHSSFTITLDDRYTLKPLHWLFQLFSTSKGLPSHAEYVHHIIDRVATLALSILSPLKSIGKLVIVEQRCIYIVDRCRAVSDESFKRSTPWFLIPFIQTKNYTAVFLGDLGGKLDDMCRMVRVDLTALALTNRHHPTYQGVFRGWGEILLEMQKARITSLQHQGESDQTSPALSELLRQWANIESKFHSPPESEKGKGKA